MFTPRTRKNEGRVGVFAAGAFNPKENVRLKDESTISLASYAARMNIQLLKAADFNEKLHEHGCSATVQKICRVAKDECEVREVLDAVWAKPSKGEEVLAEVAERNKELYEFEKMLAERKDYDARTHPEDFVKGEQVES
jgi:antirestriction protein